MSDTSYTVDAQLRLQGGGNFNAGMQSAAAKAMELDRSLAMVRGGLAQTGRGFLDMTETAVVTGVKIAAGVGAAAIAAGAVAGKAVFDNLSLLEGKGIQLASVLAASTGVPFQVMQGESSKLFDRFRQDAITSAGETKDFIDIASKLAGPLAGAGKSMDQLHDMTAGVMNAAPSLGIAFDQAGSDVMRMLQGVAGVEQPLFRAMVAIPSLGIQTAEKFNKLSMEQRYQKIAQALSNPAFAAAATAYGSSWAGLRSTLEDIAKTAGGTLGGPMFEAAKRKLAAFNDATMKALGPDGRLGAALSTVGLSLATRFDQIGDQVGRLFPSLDEGASGFVSLLGRGVDAGLVRVRDGVAWIADHWSAISDGAHRFADGLGKAADRAESIVRAIGGGDLGVGMGRIAEMLAAKKALDFAGPALGGLAQAGSGGVGVVRALLAEGKAGAGVAGAAAGAAKTVGDVSQFSGAAVPFMGIGAAAVPVAAGTAEAGAGVGAAAAGAAGGASMLSIALAALVGAIALVIIPVTAAAGALYLMRDSLTTVGTTAESTWGYVKAAFGPVGDSFQRLGYQLGMLTSGPIAGLGSAVDGALSAAIRGAGAAAEVAAAGIEAVVDAMTAVVGAANAAAAAIGSLFAKAPTLATGSPLDAPEARSFDFVAPNLAVSGPTMAMTGGSAKASPKGGGGGGKQEITIKWDLGDGNEEAIYVKTRSDFERALRSATSVSRSSPLRGTT